MKKKGNQSGVLFKAPGYRLNSTLILDFGPVTFSPSEEQSSKPLPKDVAKKTTWNQGCMEVTLLHSKKEEKDSMEYA